MALVTLECHTTGILKPPRTGIPTPAKHWAIRWAFAIMNIHTPKAMIATGNMKGTGGRRPESESFPASCSGWYLCCQEAPSRDPYAHLSGASSTRFCGWGCFQDFSCKLDKKCSYIGTADQTVTVEERFHQYLKQHGSFHKPGPQHITDLIMVAPTPKKTLISGPPPPPPTHCWILILTIFGMSQNVFNSLHGFRGFQKSRPFVGIP